MLSKAFLWKVVSMFKNSSSNGAGQRNSTLSESRSKFHYIGSPLSACMIFILLHYLLSFVTVTSSAHQRFLCRVISSSAAISVPHSVRVRRYYGPPGGGGGPSLGDRPPGGDGGPSSLGWGRTRGGRVPASMLFQSDFLEKSFCRKIASTFIKGNFPLALSARAHRRRGVLPVLPRPYPAR